ncbi:MAG: hypothetical protein EPO20_09080 [Betaproteobacteria bacterium]|nr:MAG: hypothetical protein EPO20_09080 [Betaproteobacteria bacterium]
MKRLVLVIGVAFSTAVSAQELGRLFFTPEQRAALDARRKARVPDKPAATPAVVSPTTRLDGYVRRSDGRSTVWVNGERADDASPRADGRVSVTVGESDVRVPLKPGEELDRGSGEVHDVLGPNGEVRVRPAK